MTTNPLHEVQDENGIVDYAEVFEGEDRKFWWRALSDNHKSVAVSGEGFETKAYAFDSCAEVTGLSLEKIFEVGTPEHRAHLEATNG